MSRARRVSIRMVKMQAKIDEHKWEAVYE